MHYNSKAKARRDVMERLAGLSPDAGPTSSGPDGSYNAVSFLLDRNVDEGLSDKLAFTDTVTELGYGELQRRTRRLANLLRRFGVHREERVAMIMLDTVDFPVVFLGAIRA